MENFQVFRRFFLHFELYHSNSIVWNSIKSLDGGSSEVDFIEDTHISNYIHEEEIVFRPIIDQNPVYHGIRDL